MDKPRSFWSIPRPAERVTVNDKTNTTLSQLAVADVGARCFLSGRPLGNTRVSGSCNLAQSLGTLRRWLWFKHLHKLSLVTYQVSPTMVVMFQSRGFCWGFAQCHMRSMEVVVDSPSVSKSLERGLIPTVSMTIASPVMDTS